MGNAWKGISDTQMLESEINLMRLGGVDISRVKVSDVHLDGTQNS
jgi:hypothetical protein